MADDSDTKQPAAAAAIAAELPLREAPVEK